MLLTEAIAQHKAALFALRAVSQAYTRHPNEENQRALRLALDHAESANTLLRFTVCRP